MAQQELSVPVSNYGFDDSVGMVTQQFGKGLELRFSIMTESKFAI